METEKWKDEVMGSLHGLKRAEPGPFLLTRIEARIEKKYGRVAVWKVRLATMAMISLLTVNTVVLLRAQNRDASTPSSDYQLSSIQTY